MHIEIRNPISCKESVLMNEFIQHSRKRKRDERLNGDNIQMEEREGKRKSFSCDKDLNDDIINHCVTKHSRLLCSVSNECSMDVNCMHTHKSPPPLQSLKFNIGNNENSEVDSPRQVGVIDSLPKSSLKLVNQSNDSIIALEDCSYKHNELFIRVVDDSTEEVIRPSSELEYSTGRTEAHDRHKIYDDSVCSENDEASVLSVEFLEDDLEFSGTTFKCCVEAEMTKGIDTAKWIPPQILIENSRQSTYTNVLQIVSQQFSEPDMSTPDALTPETGPDIDLSDLFK